VDSVPASYEKELGERLFAKVKEEVAITNVPAATARLNGIVDRLVPPGASGGIQFQAHLAEDGMPNAFALPGGHIIVNRGLLQFAQTPEEVAGVLAHEIAHVKLRHGFRKLLATAGHFYALKLLVGERSDLLGLIAAGSELLLRQNFSREYEQEADDAAWRYLMAAQIDPRGLARFLRRVQSPEGKWGALLRLQDKLEPRALSSHPKMAERIERLEKKWQQTKSKPEFIRLERLEM